jgi:hypothetical protein
LKEHNVNAKNIQIGLPQSKDNLKCKSNWFFYFFYSFRFILALDKMDWMFSLNSPIR